MNNINGGGGRRQALSSVDFYRRVPKDLTEVRNAFSENIRTVGSLLSFFSQLFFIYKKRQRRSVHS